MTIAALIARILLGLTYFVFGLDGFLHFVHAPMPTGPAGEFVGLLISSKWIVVVKLLEISGGALLLSGRWVPLGLVLIGPNTVNILLFHLLFEPSGLPMALVMVLLFLFLLWAYRAYFAGIFTAKAEPS